jgi:hypothetical protein
MFTSMIQYSADLDKHKNFTKISNKSGEPPDKFDGFREF